MAKKPSYKELEQRLKELETDVFEFKRMESLIKAQRDLVVSLSTASSIDEGLSFCLDAAIHVSGLDCGGVYLFDEISGALNLIFHKGLPNDFVRESSHYEPGSVNVKLVRKGKPVYTQYQQLGVPLGEVHQRENLCAIAVLPISHKKKVIGCLNVASHTLREVAAFSRIALETIAAQIGRAIIRLKAEEALRESEARYRSLVESTEDAIYLVDRDCRYLFINEKHLSRLGFVSNEVIGEKYSKYHSENDTKEFVRKVKKVFKTSASIQYEHRSRRDGRYFLRTLSPVKNSDGKTISVTIVSKDITDRKYAEQELRESSEKIKLFSYSISHDLKNLTIAIYGFTKRLHKYYANILNSKGKKYCEQILKIAEQISELVEQINVFIKTKETSLTVERLEIKEVLQVIKEEFSDQFSIRKISWLEPDYIPEVKADRLSIIRVLRNLIDNALKYGGELLSEIKIGYEESDEFHILSIKDNGIGLKDQDYHIGLKDQDYHQDIFNPFIREKTSKGIEGTGLGLTIVREIAKKHGGDVWLESRQGNGMTFCISISKNLQLSR
jgi:PAS domain S-box-containing protein